MVNRPKIAPKISGFIRFSAAVAAVILAAVVIFKAAAGVVEARPGLMLDAAAFAPFVVGPPAGNCDPSYPTVCIPRRPI